MGLNLRKSHRRLRLFREEGTDRTKTRPERLESKRVTKEKTTGLKPLHHKRQETEEGKKEVSERANHSK